MTGDASLINPRPFILEKEHFQNLIDALIGAGYRVIGPTRRDGVVAYDDMTSAADLPIGWTEEKQGSKYRLKKRRDKALFGYTVGPHSWKQYLHPARVRLWQSKRANGGFEIESGNEDAPRFAFIGVRSCELHAIAIQDQVFLQSQFVDPTYQARREQVFIVAVNCGQAGGTCFCASMNTGPKAASGYDLALTEVIDDDRHYFVVEVGTQQGGQILDTIPHQPASEEEKRTAEIVVEKAASQMGRSIETEGLKDLLYRNYENPRWDEVASRCLACANCTMVCPTCFCTTVEDVTDLDGEHAERWRRWDSCFTMDFSYIHGGSVRYSAKARYRQWMTHKLATWIDQFGTAGCVGCGRCITWCPVAIDITEEVRAIRESEK